MKITAFILLVTMMQVSAATYAQRVTLSERNTPLEQVLKKIKAQTGYDILYGDQVLADAKKITIDVKDLPLNDALDQILVNQNLTYTVGDQTVVIKPRQKTFLQNLVDRFNNIDVSGKIFDENGKPLPGASVKVKATGKAVSTDKDGKFFLRGVEEGAMLVVSFIGYLPKEVKASANMGDVVLEPSLSKLDGRVYCGSTTSAAALPGHHPWK